ncbi:MAG: alkaline phosphatase [Gemmatimonadota bacterium]
MNFRIRMEAMDDRGSRQKRVVWWAVGTLLLINLLLLLPVWIRHGRPGPHLFALEAGIVVGLFLVLPRRPWSTLLAGAAGLLVTAASVLGFADSAARMSLARPLNLYLDVQLVSAVANLLTGAVSGLWAALALGGGALAAILLTGGVGYLLARLRPGPDGSRAAASGTSTPGRGPSARLRRLRDAVLRPRSRAAGLALLVACLLAIPLRWFHPRGVALGLPGVQLVQEQSRQLTRMLAERERFAAEMSAAPGILPEGAMPLARLGGRDVILAFVESYGTTVLEDPRYAPVLLPRLEALETTLESRGLSIVTGRMVAPSQGGMSWLGHGSVLSGLWLENQLRYDLLLASDRTTLVDDFEAAGYRTVALMPAITLAWPEGERFGYDEIYAFKDIDYAGPPLNWVTMPDQFTWSFLQEEILQEETLGRDDARPVFAELGLISSHAPWTPILPVLEDWDTIGDGRVFQRWAGAGEAPKELWKDAERVREHYARAVAYAVDVMGSWAAEFVDDGTLLIALGDHQPAPLITGDDAPRTVPVHIIARDPALTAPFRERGFVPGALPDPQAPVMRMDAFREWFVSSYSIPGPDSALVTRRQP